MYRVFVSLIVIFGCLFSLPLWGQMTEDTYRRAAFYLNSNLQKQVYHLEVIPNWMGDSAFWHSTFTEEGKRFFLTNLTQRYTREAFDHQKLAQILTDSTGEKIDHRDLPLTRISFTGSGKMEFDWKGHQWSYDTIQHLLTKQPVPSPVGKSSISPDGRWEVYTKDYNLYLRDKSTGTEQQLTTDGREDLSYGNPWGWSDLIKGEQGRRPENFRVVWSPDSKKVLTGLYDSRLAEKMYLLDYSQDDRFRPELYSYYRGSPGDTTVVYEIPVVIDIETKTLQLLQQLKSPHFMPTTLRWTDRGEALTGVYYHRGFKQFDLIEVSAGDGSIRTVHSEIADTHIDYQHFFRKVGSDRFVIGSERDGWRHLYLYEWSSGRLVNRITSGAFPVLDVLNVDEESGWIYFTASGREKGINPYYPHLYKVKLDGTSLALLTPEDAFHELNLSPEGKYVVDNYSTINQPTSSVVRNLEDGSVILEISRANAPNLAERNYQAPRSFSAIGKDGKTEIFGIYHLPSDFDPLRKYPVINYSYTGPHMAVTPKTYKAALLGLQQSMAELGFVVITIDGLGTAGRSKAFQDVSYRNLGDGTTDHVTAIRKLARVHSFVDLDRVGIFGHSAGGYDAARAMLLHPDFFKVGVSSAGNHDQRMEKAWWPEMYMGYPVGEYYEEQSNVTNAHKLKGRLLLAHGSMDENVNPSGTFKFIEALIRADKDFDLFIWPSRNHSFGRTDGDYFTKKRWDYFIEHLMGEKPLRHLPLEKLRR